MLIALAALTVLDADLSRAHILRTGAAGATCSDIIIGGMVNRAVINGIDGAGTAKRTRQQTTSPEPPTTTSAW